MKARHLIVGLVIVVGASSVAVSSVSAHATLESTSPAAGSVLQGAPDQITLTFTEAIDSIPDGIRVVAGDGHSVVAAKPNQGLGDHTLTVGLPALDDGTYVVAWKAISVDSHPITGAFTFSVGAPSTPAPGLIEALVEDQTIPKALKDSWVSGGG